MSNAQIIYHLASESEEQQALIKWWRSQYPNLSMLLFHIPNGGLRNIKTAARLKSEGVVAGVADLFLAIPASGYHGHFIEMKNRRGKQSEAQKKFGNEVQKQGYLYSICYSWKEAADLISSYLKEYHASDNASTL